MREPPRQPPAFWLRLLPAVLFLLFLGGAAGAGLMVIHLRQEVAHLAASSVKLQSTLVDTGRHIQEMAAAVAMAQEPEALRARVGTRLAPMTETQIHWVRMSGSGPQLEAPAPAAAPAFSLTFAAVEPTTHLHVLR